jgi:serpin B
MKKISLFLIGLLVFYSCLNNDEEKPPFSAITKGSKFIEANNKFAFNIFKKISNEESEENFMISPVSLSLALGMTYNGAENETKTAFENTLNYTEFDSDEINTINKEVITNLTNNSSGSLFEIANSIWIENSFAVKEDFIKKNKNYYNAEIENLDFSDANSVNIINNWVSDKTHQKIPKIIDGISNETVMFLINALYFKSDWKYTFKEENTLELPFYGQNNTENVKTMHLTADLSFYKNDVFTSVILPYKNDKYSMNIFLPSENKEVSNIVDVLTNENWQNWNTSYSTEEVALALPKFKFSFEKKLNTILSDLGLENAFSNRADFSNISNRDLFISFVLQKTFIEVDEKGTEAAAVTVVGIGTTSAGPSKKIVTLNKPFLFTITEKETGSICFIGKVGMPKND